MNINQNRIEELAAELGSIHAPLPTASSPLDWQRKEYNPFDKEKVEDFDGIRERQKHYSDAIQPIIVEAARRKLEVGDSGTIFLVVNTRKAEKSEIISQLPFATKTFHFLKAETVVVSIDDLKIVNNFL